MINIPTAAKTAIDRIVKDQEGGWKLTSNVNDPDGGWTYAGVTYKTFSEYWNDHLGTHPATDCHTVAGMASLITSFPEDAEADVYSIYYGKYCDPINFDKLPTILQGPLLSAAINIGPEDAVNILQGILQCKPDGNLGSKTLAAIEHWTLDADDEKLLVPAFLREWTRHYIHLVVENAKAWRSSANTIQAGQIDKLPAVFRAGDLEGWFNRVEYWRS